VPQDSRLYGTPAFVVTTDDGTLFSCAPHAMGGDATPRALRWKLIDTQRIEYAGPLYTRETDPVAVQRIVSDWWEQRKAVAALRG
jgi:hypothetical protein